MLTTKWIITEDFSSFMTPKSILYHLNKHMCHKYSSMNKGFHIIFNWITSQEWIIWYSSKGFILLHCFNGYSFTEFSCAHHALYLAEYLFTVITNLKVLLSWVCSCCLAMNYKRKHSHTDYRSRSYPRASSLVYLKFKAVAEDFCIPCISRVSSICHLRPDLWLKVLPHGCHT